MSGRAARLGGWIRVVHRVPVGLTYGLLGAVLYAAPLRLGDWSVPMPWIAFAPVFVWAATQPRSSAAVAAFGLGLAQDVVSGGPAGPWAAGFLAGYTFVAFQREALLGHPAAAAWIVFATSMAIVAGVAGVIGAVALGGPPALSALILQAVITAAAAPLLLLPLGGLASTTELSGRPA